MWLRPPSALSSLLSSLFSLLSSLFSDLLGGVNFSATDSIFKQRCMQVTRELLWRCCVQLIDVQQLLAQLFCASQLTHMSQSRSNRQPHSAWSMKSILNAKDIHFHSHSKLGGQILKCVQLQHQATLEVSLSAVGALKPCISIGPHAVLH